MARDAEVDALHAALDGAVGGHGGVLFLTGEPGIGKSRLTQAVAATAEERALPVLRGRAVPTTTPLPYRPLAEALCSAVRSGVVADDPELTPFRSILGWLVPEWRGADAAVAAPVMALAEAVLRVLRVVAGRRGCLLVIEDLHWADAETLRIVEYLADNLTSERALCLATVRDEVASAGLDVALALHGRRASTLVRLPRLGPEGVAEMVRSCLRSEDVPAEVLDLAERADGVPFLVEELLAGAVVTGALVRDGPSWRTSATIQPVVPVAFSDSMRRRLAALADDTRAVLRVAAVLGRRFEWSLLPVITGLSDDRVLGALREAIDAQIVAVEPAGPTFSFRHALSRDAVLADLLPQELAAAARRALEALEATDPDAEADRSELAAELAERAGQTDRAAGLLLRAARRALQAGALTSAETTLERAAGLAAAEDPTRLEIDECLLEVLSLAGKRDRALEVADSLLGRLGDVPEHGRRRAEVHLSLARAALAATRWDEAYDLAERAYAETTTGDDAVRGRADAVRAQVALLREPDQAPALARDALEVARRVGMPEVACEALEVLGRSHRRHDLEAAEATFAEALAVADAHGLTLWRARALHELGTIDMLRGRSVSRLEEARDLAVAQGALATAAVVDVQIAAGLVVRDEPEVAAVATRRSADLARRYGLRQTLAAALALEAHVHARAGRRPEMQRCIEEARLHGSGAPDVEVKASFASAVFAFVQEDRAGARRELEHAMRLTTSGPGGDHPAAPWAGMLALVRELHGTSDEGAVSGPGEEPVHFMAAGFLRYARAVVAGRTGDPDGATALVAEGDRILGDHEWLRQLGRRLVAEAAVADGWGRPVPWLREALGFFDARGHERIASACRSLLRRAGATVPRRRGPDAVPAPLQALGVTARELEVLRLLALGLATREVAARLYISPRTVERHVENLSVKTGVNGRSELVAYAARTVGDTPS